MILIVDYETKQKSLFLETVVLVNGESDPEMYKDSQNDYWKSKEINTVYTTEANQTNHDIYHNKRKIDGIQTISNYISKTVENIGGNDVPIGSWRKDIMVSDDEVIELIKSNKILGVSPNNTLMACPVCVDELKNIKGNIFYNRDIENKECMEPIFTSLVDDPANGYGMNIYSYDKFLEKSKTIRGGKLSNKFKEMLKGFGESIVNYADEIDKIENPEETETNEEINETDVTETNEEIDETDVTEVTTEENNETTETSTDEVAELKKSVEKLTEEVAELKKSEVVKETDSIDDLRQELRTAIIDKHFSDEDNDVWTVLMTKESVVVENYAENKYYKVDYTADENNNITVGDLEEVEMQYVPIGTEAEEEEETEEESSEEKTPESQKSKKPKIRTQKLESVEMEKQTETKVNHLNMPIKSTDELNKAKNHFNF